MSENRTFHISSINWRWLVSTYCFLVLFHLLPSSLLSGLSLFAIQHQVVPIFVWVGVGIIAVCAYVGYRSTVNTLGEAGIASMLYVATLLVVLSKEWPPSFHYRVLGTVWIGPFFLLIFLVGLGSAAFGKWLRLRRLKKQAVSEAT